MRFVLWVGCRLFVVDPVAGPCNSYTPGYVLLCVCYVACNVVLCVRAEGANDLCGFSLGCMCM